MSKKYEFTGETDPTGLRRILRISDGLVGGWIESEANLSQNGECFVYGDARVSGNASLTENAFATDNAIVNGNAYLCGNAGVRDNAIVTSNAGVRCTARVTDNARVAGMACISGHARVSDNAVVKGNAYLTDSVTVKHHAIVRGYTYLRYATCLLNDVFVTSNSDVVFMYIHNYECTFTRDYVSIGCSVFTNENLLGHLDKLTNIPSEHREPLARSVVAFYKTWRQSNGWE